MLRLNYLIRKSLIWVGAIQLMFFAACNINAQKQTTESVSFTAKDTVVKLKKGVYKSLREFKYNMPSVLVPFSVNTKSRHYQFGKEYTHYQLEFIVKPKESLLYLDDSWIWGFCDGQHVYIAGQKRVFGQQNYDRIECFGTYVVYYEFTFGHGGNSTMGSNNQLVPKVINLDTEKTFYLTIRRVKKILASDPDLLLQFKNEEKKRQALLKYIELYNQRHVF